MKRARSFSLFALIGTSALALGWALQVPQEVPQSEEPGARPVFWTWDKLEPDTVACAWLLQKFVSPGCEIRLIADRGRSPVGTPFDVPLSDLTRTRVKSSFGVIRERFGVEGEALVRLERCMDEIETGGWEKDASSEAAALERRLREAIEMAESGEAALVRSGEILDEWIRKGTTSKAGVR